MTRSGSDPLLEADPEVAEAIDGEIRRQQETLELIASENFVSPAVLSATGSVFTNKYAEGYPGRRYYGGCEYVDVVERLARTRACELFGADHANVQPHSGSQANMAVYFTALEPGDTVLGMNLSHGGHLTHGSPVNFSGKLYRPVFYGVEKSTGKVDMGRVAEVARKEKPKLIICGASAYSRDWDYAAFRAIADEVGALLMADISHPAGLIAARLLNDPLPHCHVVTTTTHKTLRGPRGGLIMMGKDFENPWGLKTPKGETKMMSAVLDGAVFPGTQGGPLEHVIAAKAVAFGEALRPEFKVYAHAVVENAKALAETVRAGGYAIVAGGTDNHLMLVDLRPKTLTGKAAEASLGRAHITCNKNGVPFDPLPPVKTSGIRVGSPAGTTRGFGEAEFRDIGDMVADVLDGLAKNGPEKNGEIEREVNGRVRELCARFPIYS